MTTRSLPLQIAEKIMAEIKSSKIAPGEKLPPLRQLAKSYNISYVTAQRALKILQDKNYVESNSGGGSYIAEKFLIPNSNEKVQLKSNMTDEKKIGILLPTWATTLGGASVYQTIDGFSEICTQNNWTVELINSTLDDINSLELIKTIYKKKFDGFVWLTPLNIHKWILDELSHRVSCLVVSERPFENIGINTVHMNYSKLAHDALELFLKRKHKNIAVFTGQYEGIWSDSHTTVILDAIQNAAKEFGINFDENCYCQCFPLPQREAGMIIQEYLKDNQDRNAVICLHNECLPKIISELKKYHSSSEQDFTIVDTCYQSNPFYVDKVDDIEIFRVKRPNKNIGIAIANIFENKWLNHQTETAGKLEAEIISPTEMI
jgi:DNA-binding LacI/PurR family transcriptional regulator